MLKAVFFDLDGTLLPLDENQFLNKYFSLLCARCEKKGYEPNRLMQTIWKGTKAMFENDGSKMNIDVFWEEFSKEYGDEKLVDRPYFDEFYVNEFKQTKEVCFDNPYAKEIVEYCKKNLQYTILSTNPIFPLAGTITRMSFVGLKPEDFTFVTAYENSCHTKPNPKYFQDLLDKYHLTKDEVIVIGNNAYEDGECSLALGIKCYLVGEFILGKEKATHEFEHIQMDEVIKTIEKNIKLRG